MTFSFGPKGFMKKQNSSSIGGTKMVKATDVGTQLNTKNSTTLLLLFVDTGVSSGGHDEFTLITGSEFKS